LSVLEKRDCGFRDALSRKILGDHGARAGRKELFCDGTG
jgi:hypothetical protein